MYKHWICYIVLDNIKQYTQIMRNLPHIRFCNDEWVGFPNLKNSFLLRFEKYLSCFLHYFVVYRNLDALIDHCIEWVKIVLYKTCIVSLVYNFEYLALLFNKLFDLRVYILYKEYWNFFKHKFFVDSFNMLLITLINFKHSSFNDFLYLIVLFIHK